MKYCNRCFRNIVDDVNVCPFCGKADKLIDYDGEKRGENFTCNSDSSFSSHIDRDDAYNLGDEAADKAYGNQRSHNIDNCENSPETAVGLADRGTPGENFKLTLEYLRAMPQQERSSLLSEVSAEIARLYGAAPSDDATVTINGRTITVPQFQIVKKMYDRLDSSVNASTVGPEEFKKYGTLFVISIILMVVFPPVGLLMLVGIIVHLTKTQGNKK